jgi:hypothetical protein
MTDKSEWHRPAALIRTSTSPVPGGSSSISVMVNGRVWAYGPSTPTLRNNAALIFMRLTSW